MAANTAVLAKAAAAAAPSEATVTHLGTGGFASTFKVVTLTGETYALKVVDAAQSGAERTDRELGALQRVEHPNVVGYQGTGTVALDGTDYRWLRMTFVEGSTLTARWRTGQRWDHATALKLLSQAVSGAAAMWAVNTAHRDLSPNNLLVTDDDRIVIVDLGLARALEDDTITVLPTPGTPGWMSPEQVGASPTHGDWRSDQFVLGLIGYRLITGANPFTFRNRYDAWLAPAQQMPRPLRDLDPTTPTVLADVIMKMLAAAPHRRYLQPHLLLADLERAAATLAIPQTSLSVTPEFLLSVGDSKSFATSSAFLPTLAPDAVIVEPRGRDRVAELFNLTRATGVTRIADPCTYLARSPMEHRPAYYKALPFGNRPVLTGFSSATDREAFCAEVLDFSLAAQPDVVLAPYFYAAAAETVWIEESLRCAAATAELLQDRAPGRGGQVEPMWTTVAVSHAWLTQSADRDRLLTLLTSQPAERLNLLVHTPQQTFAPLADRAVLDGMVETLTVMREAGVPVVLGRRASEGLLGLALGAAGWGTGVAGVQMNMNPHPESAATGGPGYDRIYVPQLLTHLTTPTYVQMAAADASLVAPSTSPGHDLLAQNATLEQLSRAQRVLLLQHNVIAARDQVSHLAALTPAERISRMRQWVTEATEAFQQLPAPAGPGESSGFLSVWRDLLS